MKEIGSAAERKMATAPDGLPSGPGSKSQRHDERDCLAASRYRLNASGAAVVGESAGLDGSVKRRDVPRSMLGRNDQRQRLPDRRFNAVAKQSLRRGVPCRDPPDGVDSDDGVAGARKRALTTASVGMGRARQASSSPHHVGDRPSR
jgi:hypothetical protein